MGGSLRTEIKRASVIQRALEQRGGGGGRERGREGSGGEREGEQRKERGKEREGGREGGRGTEKGSRGEREREGGRKRNREGERRREREGAEEGEEEREREGSRGEREGGRAAEERERERKNNGSEEGRKRERKKVQIRIYCIVLTCVLKKDSEAHLSSALKNIMFVCVCVCVYMRVHDMLCACARVYRCTGRVENSEVMMRRAGDHNKVHYEVRLRTEQFHLPLSLKREHGHLVHL